MGPVSHLAGRYLLQQRVGGSGRSEVWQAWDEVLARTVAVRLVSAKRAGPGFRRRFQDEVRAAAGVLHPHLVVIYDYGEAAGPNRVPAPYVIMEFFDGESLADRLERGVPILSETVRTFTQLASALTAAHAAGIVHCDLKPANVLLTPGGTKLLGLGIARVLRDETCFASGADRLGGPENHGPEDHGPAEMPVYLAPEDLGDGPAAPPTDVYAFGVMLAEALTGSRAFDAPMPPQVPPEVVELCARCRSTDPAARRRRGPPRSSPRRRPTPAPAPRSRDSPVPQGSPVPPVPSAPRGSPVPPAAPQTWTPSGRPVRCPPWTGVMTGRSPVRSHARRP